MRYTSVLMLIIYCSLPPQAYANDRLGEIRIEGNEITEQHVILREMLVKPGDEVDLARIDDSVQNIMDLGLFEKVDYYLEQQTPDGDTDMVIQVTERYYFFLIPTAKTNDNNQLEYGAKLIWHNIFGQNHSVKWKLLEAGETAGTHEYKNQFVYSAPYVFDSPYQVNFSFLQDVFVDDDPVTGLQAEKTARFIIDILRWFDLDGTGKHYYAGLGLADESRQIRHLTSALPLEEFSAISLRATVGYKDVEEHAYSRKGIATEYRIQHANDATGPNGNEFLLQDFSYSQYIMLSESPPRNINFNLGLGRSSNDVLGDKAFNLGGNSNLRGYDLGTFRDNTQIYGSIEYLDMLFDNPLIRKVVFVDFGDTVNSLSDINLGHINAAVGLGIRWKARRFVNFNLRLDIAYGFDTDEVRVAIGSKHAF